MTVQSHIFVLAVKEVVLAWLSPCCLQLPRELTSNVVAQARRELLEDSICADLFQAVVCGLVIVAAIFGAHWLVGVASKFLQPESFKHEADVFFLKWLCVDETVYGLTCL